MKIKLLTFLTAAFVFALFAGLFDTKTSAKNASELAALLPASDIVVTMDAQKTFNTALPQVLSANQEMLDRINAHIDEMKTKIGIDARQFEQIAVGAKTRQISPQQTEVEPFILARGTFNSTQLITIAKLASKGKYTEEKIGSRTVYVFKINELSAQNKPQTSNSFFGRMMDKMLKSLSSEIAVTAFDNNTLAFGTAARVREAFAANSKSRVSAEMLGLANKNPNAVVNFGGKMPKGIGALLPLDNDELGKTIDAISQFSGSLDVADGKTNLFVMAKTLKEDDALNLYDTIDAMRSLGKMFLGGNKNPDKQVYARMIENANITRNGTEVSLDLQVPQSDLDVIVGKK
ncbi:MAG: hypothetical protein ABIP06_03345 [Pyrinomonadaceae bacterium]